MHAPVPMVNSLIAGRCILPAPSDPMARVDPQPTQRAVRPGLVNLLSPFAISTSSSLLPLPYCYRTFGDYLYSMQ